MYPDFDLLTRQYWGSGNETAGFLPGACGITVGSNPPYSVTDFLAFHPKFGGAPSNVTGTLAAGSAVVTSVTAAGLAAGQLVTGTGIAAGTTIAAVDSVAQTVTLSSAATASGPATLTVYVALLTPLAVINAYIAFASASITESRWKSAWQLAMGWFVAHFLTLWLRSDGGACATPAQAAATGLAQGIMVSKSAGSVSVGYQAIQGLEQWGAWTQTSYGQQFATMAKVIGMGPMLVW